MSEYLNLIDAPVASTADTITIPKMTSVVTKESTQLVATYN